MAKDADQIVVGANGTISVAPKGTALPTTLAALAGTYKDLGLVTEDGATFSDSKTIENIMAWQAFGPVRRVVTEKDTTLAFQLLQWSPETIKLAFGGGDITAAGTAPNEVFTYHPPEPGDIDERVAVLDWVDGDYSYRLVIADCMVTEGVETNLVKNGAAGLPITLGANHEAGADTWYLITDDPAFDPAP